MIEIRFKGETWETYDGDYDEWDEMPSQNKLKIINDGKETYFKKAETFPKVFKQSEGHRLEVTEEGGISIYNSDNIRVIIVDVLEEQQEKDIEALRQAIAESDRIRENKK